MELVCSTLNTASSITSRFQAPPPSVFLLRRPNGTLPILIKFKKLSFYPALFAVSGGGAAVSSNIKAEESPVSGGNEGDDVEEDKMRRVCDKLIEVFMVDKPTPSDWRKLLAFSRTWDTLRPHFFKRCQERADGTEDPNMKVKLLRFTRKMKEIDADVRRHNELLGVIKNAPSEMKQVIARRRKDFTEEFFLHFFDVIKSYHNNPDEQAALAKLGNDCVAAVEAHDNAGKEMEALDDAQLKLQDIFNSPTVEAACQKIDNLAAKNQLDPSLALMLTKAWSSGKETNLVKQEAKDIIFHLYKTGIGNLERLMPKDVRILKYIMMIKDPEEQLSVLKDAFTPGLEIEGPEVDTLYTTPEMLYAVMKSILDAYYNSQEGTVIREARDLMDPKFIQKIEHVKKLVEVNFL